jgi:FkbM family methyltransferase
MLSKLKRKIARFVYRIIPPPKVKGYYSFSQAGEDAVIDFLFKGIGIRRPSYLELGVFLPDISNNTYKYYLAGSKGVLIEADIDQISKIRRVRPNDTILNVGVGVFGENEADFYVFDARGLNTFDKEEALKREKQGTYKIVKVVRVALRPVNKIIEENFDTYPDFLSIDIEGLDLEVLKSLDLDKYPIPVICAETCTYSENHIKPKDVSISKFMETKGYFVYADTYINTIFVRSDWFNRSCK